MATNAALLTTDWNEEWKALCTEDDAPTERGKWNKRALHFKKTDGVDDYSERFIELLALQPGESVLDMGCGTGAIALPLASAGHRVVARDVSEGMLGVLLRDAQEQGVEGIDAARLAWQDDWVAGGITPGMCDVAFASRSLITQDLHEALSKLTMAARRRVCVTFTAGASPRLPLELLPELGIHERVAHDFVYAMNMLIQDGFYPTLDYILCPRVQLFADEQAARDRFEEALEHAEPFCSAETLAAARKRLGPWLEQNLVANEHAGEPDGHGELQGSLRLRRPRIIRWAFLAWDK